MWGTAASTEEGSGSATQRQWKRNTKGSAARTDEKLATRFSLRAFGVTVWSHRRRKQDWCTLPGLALMSACSVCSSAPFSSAMCRGSTA